jgi:hypothetical protein
MSEDNFYFLFEDSTTKTLKVYTLMEKEANQSFFAGQVKSSGFKFMIKYELNRLKDDDFTNKHALDSTLKVTNISDVY